MVIKIARHAVRWLLHRNIILVLILAIPLAVAAPSLVRMITAKNTSVVKKSPFSDRFTIRHASGDLTSNLEAKKQDVSLTVSRGQAKATFAMAVSPANTTHTKDEIVYTAKDGLRMRYQPIQNGIKEEIILDKPMGRSTFLSTLSVANVRPIVTPEGQIVFVDQNGTYQFHIMQPFAIDANGTVTRNIRYRLTDAADVYKKLSKDINQHTYISQQLLGPVPQPSGPGIAERSYMLVLDMDPSWLSDPSRAYPVTIDPTVVHDTTSEFATGTMNRVKDTGSGSAPYLESYYQPLIADRHTVGLWHLDEASGDATDASGNSLTGTNTGSTATTGVFSNGRSFDGSGNKIIVAHSAKFPTVERTVEAWVKITSTTSADRLLMGEGSEHWFTYDGATWGCAAGQIGYMVWINSAWSCVSGFTPSLNRWYHIAGTYNGNTIQLYVDGVLINKVSNTGSFTPASNSFDIGNYSGGGYGLPIVLDDVRLSNVARSAEDIKSSASRRSHAIYMSDILDLTGGTSSLMQWNSFSWNELGVATGDGESLKDTTSLYAQWNLNETSGTTAVNAAGSCGVSCNGTLTNFASTSSQDQAAGTGWTTANKRWGAGSLMFDGADDWISVASNPLTNSYVTINTWIKTSKISASRTIIDINTAANAGGMLLNFRSDCPMSLGIAMSWRDAAWVSGAYPFICGSRIDDGRWHMVTGVYDSQGAKLYVDGILANSSTRNSTLSNQSQTINIGKLVNQAAGAGYNFNGVIDATTIYSRALTAAEILSNYNASNIEFQTRVGNSSSPDDGSWEAWRPTTSETLIEGFENNEDNTRVYEMGFSAPGINPTWAKKNNAVPANSDTTTSDGRIPLGTNGTGDDTHAYGPALLKDGATYKMWYSGSDGATLRIYYATSSDGLTWTKYNNAIPSTSDTTTSDGRIPLGTNGTGDDAHTGYPTVIKDGSTYKMWYSGHDGSAWRIFYATSSDGLTWTKYNNAIESPSNTTGTQGRIPLGSSGGDTSQTVAPTVIKDGSTYKMWYSGSDGTNWRIYHATSSDGLTWTKYDNSIPAASDSTSTNGRIPLGSTGVDTVHSYIFSVIKDGPVYKGWYSMQDASNTYVGYVSSLDGLSWRKYHNAAPTASNTTSTNGRIARGASGGDVTHAFSPAVIKDGAVYKVWYAGYDSTNWRIYHASMKSITLSQNTESVIKQESSYSEKFTTAPQADGSVVGLWHLDETGGTGAYIKDSSGNANHGTPTGTTLSMGKFNKARTFDGNNDYIDLGTGATFDFGNNGPFTHSGWVNITTMLNYAGFVSKVVTGRGGTYSYMTVVMADGSMAAYTGAAWVTPCPAGSVSAGRWQHIAFSYDGTNITGYVNGVSCGSIAFTYTDNTAHNLYIGSWYSPSTIYDFNGQIDEVVTSKAARSGEEIAEEYRLGRDHYMTKTISSTDLSGKKSLPFNIAADRPGTYLQTVVGESDYVNYQPDSSTGGFWHFDETISPVKDAAGKVNGSITGTTSVQGKIGRGRYFNGTSDYVAIADVPTLNPSSQITAEAWIRTTGTGSNLAILGKTTGCASSGYLLWLNENGVGAGLPGFFIGAGAWLDGTIAVNDGKWHHIVGTFDGSTARLYIDGALNASGARSGTLTSTTQLQIGGQTTGAGCTGGLWFPGDIDEVRISSTARSAAEIRQAFEIGLRSHAVTIDFAAALDSGNLITGSGDTGFTIDATTHGLGSKGSGLYLSDKLIVRENYDGTEYIAQGTVTAVTTSTGAVTVASWDTGSTFPSGGYTANASIFKWQREFWNIDSGAPDDAVDAVTNLTLRLTDGIEGRTIWLDDFRSAGDYLTTPAGSTITSSTGNRYIQYRAILHSSDEAVSPQLTSVTLDYRTNVAPSAPTNILTEGAANPTGVIDTTPEFSAIYVDGDSGDIANKYRIQVDDNSNFLSVLWDSGASGTSMANCTAGNRCADVSYAGSSLTQGTTYYVRFAFWDDDNTEGAWSSESALFTMNAAQSAPTLDSPSNGATNRILTVSLKTTGTDTDGDYLRYKIELCTNVGMTANCQTFDQTSSQTGWSGQNTQTSTAYTSGTQATYTIQTPLTVSTTYYWRSYSIDPGGTNTWSPTQGAPYSFTTTDGTTNFTVEGLQLDGINLD